MTSTSNSISFSEKIKISFWGSLFFLLANIAPWAMSGQSTYGDYLSSNKQNLADEIIKPSVQSPDVAAFQKTNFITTSNFTGRANVSVPVYTIDYGGMQVPISLSYNTSGVKVASMSSRVGLNWSLHAGGVVSRVIQGLDDFTYPAFLGSDADMRSPEGWLAGLNPNKEDRGYPNPNNDALPDKFIVSAPGLNTEFVTKKNGTALDLRRSGNIFNPDFDFVDRDYIAPSGNSAIASDFGLNSLEVTSLDGIKYYFETLDLTNGTAGGFDIPTNYLDSMTNLNTGETITFEYESFSNYYHDDTELYVTSYGGGTLDGFRDKDSYTYFRLGQRLKKINYDTGSVEFIYSQGDRLDYPGEKALTRILVKDYNGKIVKDFRLSHSYFQSGIESGTPESKRLRLDEVFEVNSSGDSKPGYKFTYNTSYDMPPRDSYAYDFLGYNNGVYSSGNSDPSPKMYFYDNKITPLYRSSAIALPGNYSMAASFNYAKAYSLKKIELPTGGSNEFEYELNQFSYKGKIYSGAGLRIKTQYLKAADGADQIIDYEYSSGSIGLMPTYAAVYLKSGSFSTPSSLSNLTNQLGIDTFSSPRSQIELNNGSFVGYQRVQVSNRNSTGYTDYAYYINSNTPSLKYNPSDYALNAISNDWRNLNDGLLFIDNDFMRGIELSKSLYDENGDLVSYRKSEYELQNTQRDNLIGLTFYNLVNNACTDRDNYYRSPVDYFEECGGYKEVIELLPSRYVLRKVRTVDFALEGEDPMVQEPDQGILVEKKYTYDAHYPLITTEFIANYRSGSQQDAVNAIWSSRKDISYPVTGHPRYNPEINSYPYAQQLYDQNRVSTPMEVEISGRSYSKQTFDYDDFGLGLISLKKVNTELRNNTTIPSAEISKRNERGLPIEIIKENGKLLSIIYGYRDSQIIAIVNGASYNDINTWFNSDFGKSLSYLGQLADADNSSSTENTLKNWLKNLRSAIESHSVQTTTVKTFTHDPEIGVTSIIDERGMETTYSYDAFSRLKETKNDDSDLLEYYNYNFKN